MQICPAHVRIQSCLNRSENLIAMPRTPRMSDFNYVKASRDSEINYAKTSRITEFNYATWPDATCRRVHVFCLGLPHKSRKPPKKRQFSFCVISNHQSGHTYFYFGLWLQSSDLPHGWSRRHAGTVYHKGVRRIARIFFGIISGTHV